MFDVAGIESLAGGRTGGTPYGGEDGQKRWNKMKENVTKEWEEEQRKKKEQAERDAALQEERALDNTKPQGNSGQQDITAKIGKLDKLKAKLFKH